jgi:hypothetical protein
MKQFIAYTIAIFNNLYKKKQEVNITAHLMLTFVHKKKYFLKFCSFVYGTFRKLCLFHGIMPDICILSE